MLSASLGPLWGALGSPLVHPRVLSKRLGNFLAVYWASRGRRGAAQWPPSGYLGSPQRPSTTASSLAPLLQRALWDLDFASALGGGCRSLERSTSTQDRLQMAQESSKTTQEHPKSAPRPLTMALGQPKTAPREPKMAPGCASRGPRVAKIAPFFSESVCF